MTITFRHWFKSLYKIRENYVNNAFLFKMNVNVKVFFLSTSERIDSVTVCWICV